MNFHRLLFLASIFGFCMISCKEEGKNPEVVTTETVSKEIVKPPKKELTEEDRMVINSVFSKIMTTEELNTFARASVTANISELLSKQKGPFTVFAPSNEAFSALSKSQMDVFQNPANKEALITLLESHIALEEISSADMVQRLKQKESLELTTASGSLIKVKKDGMELWVEDALGNTAKIGKSDILGGNGVVHVIDTVLGFK